MVVGCVLMFDVRTDVILFSLFLSPFLSPSPSLSLSRHGHPNACTRCVVSLESSIAHSNDWSSLHRTPTIVANIGRGFHLCVLVYNVEWVFFPGCQARLGSKFVVVVDHGGVVCQHHSHGCIVGVHDHGNMQRKQRIQIGQQFIGAYIQHGTCKDKKIP